MIRDEEYYREQYWGKERTIADIADEHHTHPNQILREMRRLGVDRRSRSEAQAVALKLGRHKHPTKGKRRDVETRTKISNSLKRGKHGPQED